MPLQVEKLWVSHLGATFPSYTPGIVPAGELFKIMGKRMVFTGIVPFVLANTPRLNRLIPVSVNMKQKMSTNSQSRYERWNIWMFSFLTMNNITYG